MKFDDNGMRKGWWSGLKDGLDKIWHRRAIMKRTEFATLAAAFAHKNNQALIVLADPETDVILVSYDDQHAVNRITDITGQSMKVVKKALNGEEESIMNLLGYIGSAIKDNRTAIVNRYQDWEKTKKEETRLVIEKSEVKKKREVEMAKIRREQEKTDIKTGLKKLFPEKKETEKEKHIKKLKEIFNK